MMYKFIIPLLILFCFGYVKSNAQTTVKNKFTLNDVKSNTILVTDDLYDLEFIVESDNNKLFLIIAIKLHKGSYYISPNSRGDFSGIFNLDLGDYNNLSFYKKLIETPLSEETYDNADNPANKVYINTIYKQELNLNTEKDFEVFGRVQFTIEPRCTYEEIPFGISFKNGEIKIFSPKC